MSLKEKQGKKGEERKEREEGKERQERQERQTQTQTQVKRPSKFSIFIVISPSYTDTLRRRTTRNAPIQECSAGR